MNADRLIVEAEGTAFKTASLPNSVYQARAISNALKSALQSGAQSLDSFSLVENGKVLFDQISAQSNVQIAGYRVLSTKDHGNKLSARLEILLLPSRKNMQPSIVVANPLASTYVLSGKVFPQKRLSHFGCSLMSYH